MFDTRQLTIGAAGTGQKSWVLPGGYQIAGIRVDNPSGSWIVLPDGVFIPPYTLGFGHSFQPMISRIDVLFSAGPASQVSTQQGDKPTVVIFSDPVGESPGVPSGAGQAFINQFTPVITVEASGTVVFTTGLSTIMLPAVANKRYRILTFSAALEPFGPPANYDSGVFYSFNSTVTQAWAVRGRLSLALPSRQDTYGEGLDMPLGEGGRLLASADFAQNFISCIVTALLI